MATPLPRLDVRIPEMGFPNPDDAMEAFLGWVADCGLTLYPHQEAAILEVFAGNHVVLDTPTGSGKSLVAVAMHFRSFAGLGRTWYTAPIKALVSEKFFALCAIFGAEHVGMMTGDGTVNRTAPIICCTAEILANLALREGEDAPVHSVVMDEFHYYGDRDRGSAWQIPLLTLPRSTFLLMSATLGDTTQVREDLQARTGRTVAEVRGVHRPVPLLFSYSIDPIHDALNKLVVGGKAPVYIVHFTQNDATEQAQALMSVDYCTKEEKKAISEAIRGFRFTSPFGPTIRRYVAHGIGLHHAGLLPRYRLLVERLAQQGLLKIICGTDTLGVGINVPIRTVLFTQLCKFDGVKVDLLKVRDFKQIAGRAGRAGFDTVGYVVAQAPAHIIENHRLDQKAGDDPKKRRKIVRAKPPEKGYRHWDEAVFQQLIERPPEVLQPQLAVDHGRLLMLMQHAQERTGDAQGGYEALLTLIDQSHAPPHVRVQLRTTAEGLLENLRKAGVVGMDGDHLILDPTLQRDFSLHHSLSLFLLAAIESVDPASPTHAADVVSWVEAILENPRQVLLRQVDRAKFALIQELKAAGVPYEDRIAALEDITWPKPNAEAIYAFFNGYKDHHPWVGAEAIRPKSVVREMAEIYTSFAEYIGELGLQRSEGVLLRYLSEAYKALVQNVPSDRRTDTLLDIMAWLRAMLAVVDSSLVTEWERLVEGADAPEAPAKIDISAEPRVFAARVRAELHGLVRAIAHLDWVEATAAVRDLDGVWSPDAIAALMEPFVVEHGGVRFDHDARMARRTTITREGAHQWRVRQLLLPLRPPEIPPEEGEEDVDVWTIEGRIDLRTDTNPDGPLVELVGIGP